MGGGLVLAAGSHRCLDEVQHHPHRVRNVRCDGPSGADGTGVSVRVLEVAASDRVERSGMQNVDVHCSRSSRHGPSGDLVRDRTRVRAVPACGGEQRLQGTRRPTQEPVAVGVTQSDGFVGHLGERVPLAGEEGVEAEERQGLD